MGRRKRAVVEWWLTTIRIEYYLGTKMNKRYWLLPKITLAEIREMHLTEADRRRIKAEGERAVRFISAAMGMCAMFERNGINEGIVYDL